MTLTEFEARFSAFIASLESPSQAIEFQSLIVAAQQMERHRQARWVEDLMSNGVTVLSAGEVAQAVRNNSSPY